MIDVIYVEEGIAEHSRTQQIIKSHPKASIIPCENYKEVFNPSGQNFRLQKNKPSLILAEKKVVLHFLYHPVMELGEQTTTSPHAQLHI